MGYPPQGTKANLATLEANVDELLLEMAHATDLFPEDSDETVTFTAGDSDNAFGDWDEIVDNNAVTFSSKFASKEGHISGLLIEDLDTKDKLYILEIAYGDDKTPVLTHRFVAGDVKKLNAIQFMRIRAEKIPAGETVYYRMKCGTKDATCEVSFRYHYHE